MLMNNACIVLEWLHDILNKEIRKNRYYECLFEGGIDIEIYNYVEYKVCIEEQLRKHLCNLTGITLIAVFRQFLCNDIENLFYNLLDCNNIDFLHMIFKFELQNVPLFTFKKYLIAPQSIPDAILN
jgi:hypothetical protein